MQFWVEVVAGKWRYATTRGLNKDGLEAKQGLDSISFRFKSLPFGFSPKLPDTSLNRKRDLNVS